MFSFLQTICANINVLFKGGCHCSRPKAQRTTHIEATLLPRGDHMNGDDYNDANDCSNTIIQEWAQLTRVVMIIWWF